MCTLEPKGRWLKGEIVDNNAVHAWCDICCKPIENCFCNFSEAFVTDISGSATKRERLDSE